MYTIPRSSTSLSFSSVFYKMNVERATRTRLRKDSFTQVSSVTHETRIVLDIEMLQNVI